LAPHSSYFISLSFFYFIGCYFFFFFFFSSRRRHTRWPRDWSSDVCSSDLYRPVIPHTNRRAAAGASRIVATSSGFLRIFFAHAFAPKLASDACRSASGRRSASHPLRSTFRQGYHPTDRPTHYYLIHDRR